MLSYKRMISLLRAEICTSFGRLRLRLASAFLAFLEKQLCRYLRSFCEKTISALRSRISLRDLSLEAGKNTSFAHPPFQAIELGCLSTSLFINSLTCMAPLEIFFGVINEHQTTCFSDPVLEQASLSECGPLPISTGKSSLVIETHVFGIDELFRELVVDFLRIKKKPLPIRLLKICNGL